MEMLFLFQNILAGSILVSLFGFLVFGLYTIIYRLIARKDRFGALSETKR